MGYGAVITAFLDEIEKVGAAATGQELATQGKAPRNVSNPTNIKLPDPSKVVSREASSTRPGGAPVPNPTITGRMPGPGGMSMSQGSGNTSDVTGLLTRIGNSRTLT